MCREIEEIEELFETLENITMNNEYVNQIVTKTKNKAMTKLYLRLKKEEKMDIESYSNKTETEKRCIEVVFRCRRCGYENKRYTEFAKMVDHAENGGAFSGNCKRCGEAVILDMISFS